MKNSQEFIQRRNHDLLRYIEEQGAVTVSELVEHFSLSPATVRRTLNQLEEERMVIRTHGGAKSLQTVEHLTLEIKTNVDNVAAKSKIAQLASTKVQDGDVIALGCGSTTLFLAKLLHDKKNLTVLTDSVYVAAELMNNESISVYLSGGFVHNNCGAAFSSNPSDLFHSSCVNKVFIGVDGISLATQSVSAMAHLTQAEREIISCGEKVYVLADHTKFEKRAMIERLATFQELDYLITDVKPEEDALDSLEQAGVQVLF